MEGVYQINLTNPDKSWVIDVVEKKIYEELFDGPLKDEEHEKWRMYRFFERPSQSSCMNRNNFGKSILFSQLQQITIGPFLKVKERAFPPFLLLF